MSQAAAKKGDRVLANDTHIVLLTILGIQVPIPLFHPFVGTIDNGLSSNVNIMGQPAATVASTASNNPHVPVVAGTVFQTPPANLGTIKFGSQSVRINGKAAARHGDVAETCNDPANAPVGKVVAVGSVMIG